MSKIKDLSATYKRIPTAEQELEIPLGTIQMGQRIGGVSMNSNSFKRGYGDHTFGLDENGMWMGSADFANGKFKVSIDGSMYVESADGGMVWDSATNRILINISGTDQILIGEF